MENERSWRYPQNSYGEQLEVIGDITVNWTYWDCQCSDNYIRPVAELECVRCGMSCEDGPSSREDEVVHFRELKGNGEQWWLQRKSS